MFNGEPGRPAFRPSAHACSVRQNHGTSVTTECRGRKRESEGSVVATKSGNADGAKGARLWMHLQAHRSRTPSRTNS